MRIRAIIVALVVAICWPASGWATLIVNAAKPITHRVTIQIIETAKSDGTSPATIFGDATQRASIIAGIDTIWAQAGIDIHFSAPIVRYNNTFAYEGTPGNNSPRPESDLSTMISHAWSTGILNPSTSVIKMFFVNIVPLFSFTSESTVNGLANLGSNGIAAFVGDNLLSSQNNLDVVASVISHEIGHNLGLQHSLNGGDNLMSPNGTSAKLSSTQIAAVFQTTFRNDSIAFIPDGGTGFPQSFSPPLAGDYNLDSTVNAADFVLWRNSLGSTTNLTADGNNNLVVDAGDYTLWRSNFGRTPAGAAGAGLVGVPEPTACILLLLCSAVLSGAQRFRRHAK